MQLHCEVCRSPLRAEDVRLDIAVAKCHACNAVYDLSGRKARGLGVEPRPRLLRPKAALPRRFQVDDDGTTTRISWRWFATKTLILGAFCVFWDGFLFVWYGAALSRDEAPLMMLVFPLLHVAVGVGLTYSVLLGLFNRTHIEASRSRLTIRHGPLPWQANQTLERGALAQLYGEEVLSASDDDGKRTVSYSLIALDREGRKVKLVSGLEEKDQVLYLEQALERRLGIEDAPVDGEVATRTQVA